MAIVFAYLDTDSVKASIMEPLAECLALDLALMSLLPALFEGQLKFCLSRNLSCCLTSYFCLKDNYNQYLYVVKKYSVTESGIIYSLLSFEVLDGKLELF